jgi:hypothetical protein
MNDPEDPLTEPKKMEEVGNGNSDGITLSPRAAKVTLGAKERANSVGAQGPDMKDTMSFVSHFNFHKIRGSG